MADKQDQINGAKGADGIDMGADGKTTAKKESVDVKSNGQPETCSADLKAFFKTDDEYQRTRQRDITLLWTFAEATRAKEFERIEQLLGCSYWWYQHFGLDEPKDDFRISDDLKMSLSRIWDSRKIDKILGYEIVDEGCSILTVQLDAVDDAAWDECIGKVSFVIFGEKEGSRYVSGYFDGTHWEYERYMRADGINVLFSLNCMSPFSMAKVSCYDMIKRVTKGSKRSLSQKEFHSSFNETVTFPDMPYMTGSDLALHVDLTTHKV